MQACLFSTRISDTEQELIDQLARDIGKQTSTPKIAIILNALDGVSNTIVQTQVFNRAAKIWQSMGCAVEQIDLADYFDRSTLLEKKLTEYQGIYVEDGNVFVLRAACAQSGLDLFLKKQAASAHSWWYVGAGAGAVVAGSELHGFERVYETAISPDRYKPLSQLLGMALVPYMFIPHFRSDHKDSQPMNGVVEYAVANKHIFKAFRDSEGVIEKAVSYE